MRSHARVSLDTSRLKQALRACCYGPHLLASYEAHVPAVRLRPRALLSAAPGESLARSRGTAGLCLPLLRLERAHYGGVLRAEWGVATAESRPANRQDREQLLEDQLQL